MTLPGLRRRRMLARRTLAPLPTAVFPGSEGRPFPLLSDLVLGYGRGAPGPSVLYLGDSSVLRVAHQDQDQRPLGQMVQDALGGPDVLLWSAGSAHQPELWQDVVGLFVDKLEKRPATLLLPVNLRTFSSQWSGNPVWALTAERQILASWQPARMVPPVPTLLGDARLFARYDRRPAGLAGLGRLGELRRLASRRPDDDRTARDDRLVRLFRWHYGEPLPPDHPRLEALVKTATSALALGIVAVAYVTPVNVGAVERLGVPALLAQLRTNIEQVATALSGKCTLVDLHDLLDEDAFFHANLATEHLAQKGRTALTARIIGLLGKAGP